MKSMIKNLPIDAGKIKSNMKVGFITYDNTVHFYGIHSPLAPPTMKIIINIENTFMPFSNGFLCDVEESETIINIVIEHVLERFGSTRKTETILAAGLQVGLEALKTCECAGKLLIFHSSSPITEEQNGKLINRDDHGILGTDKEKTVLAPQNNVYNNLGQECVDVSIIGQICCLTGGEIHKYTYFQADIDGERLISDVINNISRPIAVMRVHTSKGIRVTDFYEYYFMSNATDMEFASIDCDKAIGIEVKHDDELIDNEGVHSSSFAIYLLRWYNKITNHKSESEYLVADGRIISRVRFRRHYKLLFQAKCI